MERFEDFKQFLSLVLPFLPSWSSCWWDHWEEELDGRLEVRLYFSPCVVSGDKHTHFWDMFIFKLGLLERNMGNPMFRWLLTARPMKMLWENSPLPTAHQDPPLSLYLIHCIYRSVQFHSLLRTALYVLPFQFAANI